MIIKNAVVFSAGIGNAILMIPLLKKLKSEGAKISIILNSVFINKEFIEYNNFPYDEVIELSRIDKFKFIVNNFKRYEKIFLDYSSSSVKNILLSTLISKKIIVMRKKHLYIPNVTYITEKKDTHAAVSNLQLLNKTYTESDFNISDLKLDIKNSYKSDLISKIESNRKIPVIIQTSSSNLTAPYKNWPTEYWILFLNNVSIKFPNLYFILMGDENEIVIGKKLENELKSNFTNLIGKTNLLEMCSIIYHSKFYIGLDSGLMHLAVGYNIPTFSIFGASSYNCFGYEKFSTNHKVIFNMISCWPCLGYNFTNKLKVNNPKDCDDHECLNLISPNFVFNEFQVFYQKLYTKNIHLIIPAATV